MTKLCGLLILLCPWGLPMNQLIGEMFSLLMFSICVFMYGVADGRIFLCAFGWCVAQVLFFLISGDRNNV